MQPCMRVGAETPQHCGCLVATTPRTGRNYRRLSAQYKAECKQRRAPCCHCAQRIDYTLDPNNVAAFTVEHIKPVSTHPHLVEDVTNWAASHRSCNASRGVKDMTPGMGTASQDW